MNNYILMRRLRGPVFLVGFGVLSLLRFLHVMPGKMVLPIALIAIGVYLLAERMSLMSAGSQTQAYSETPYEAPSAGTYSAETSTEIVPAHMQDDEKEIPEGLR